jgi:hypothetical protein
MTSIIHDLKILGFIVDAIPGLGVGVSMQASQMQGEHQTAGKPRRITPQQMNGTPVSAERMRMTPTPTAGAACRIYRTLRWVAAHGDEHIGNLGCFPKYLPSLQVQFGVPLGGSLSLSRLSNLHSLHYIGSLTGITGG